jgi:hypothetical protein
MQNINSAAAKDHSCASLISRPSVPEGMEVHGRFSAKCYDKHGNLKWEEEFNNLVVTVGKNDMLDKYLAGSSWTTGTVYMGLKGTGTALAADTMSSHGSWTQLNITSARGSVTFSAASSGTKATSSAVSFAITAAGPTTVAGVYIVIGGTSGNTNTTGVLYSAGDFSVSRSVVAADTLDVSYSTSLT